MAVRRLTRTIKSPPRTAPNRLAPEPTAPFISAIVSLLAPWSLTKGVIRLLTI